MNKYKEITKMNNKGALDGLQEKINASKMEMRAYDKKQVGRKLIANVLYIINEVTPNL